MRAVCLVVIALVLTIACDPARPLDSNDLPPPSDATATLSSYFPPSEAAGGWRKTTDPAKVKALGIDANRLSALGSYLTTLPFESYATGVSGYSASNKAAIVVKNGWIVGEYHNQASAATAVYYLASNGKTFTIMLVGRMARDYPQYNFGLASKLYDKRWLPQGFPLSDSRKSAITFDLVFRHASAIVPEAEAAIASGAVRSEAGWEFVSFTVGQNAAFPVSAPLYYSPGHPASYPKGSAYSGVAFNHFSLIFRTVTGLEPSQYLRASILNRIGVGRMAYKLVPGLGDYRWATAGNGLASARDFARIGYLMLHDGRWGGTQVLPAGWLSNFTTSPDYRNIRSNVDCRWGAKFPADMYRTTGSGLNWVLVVPSLDMMLTFNGRTPKSLAAEVDTVSLKKLFAAVTQRYVTCDGTVVNGTSAASAPPVASFSSTCSGLVCSLTDASYADGTGTAWRRTFGDGTSSTYPASVAAVRLGRLAHRRPRRREARHGTQHGPVHRRHRHEGQPDVYLLLEDSVRRVLTAPHAGAAASARTAPASIRTLAPSAAALASPSSCPARPVSASRRSAP
ncbi:MAG: serine hydrolase, partial [Gemmatimonadales bacterium]